ncbi:GNAT family N-acetyltransferase [Nodularia spumigena]|uniref:GNAT family N-acetyltransferase n=2 Tax=Cyanophyceae TaxID=3028117 RepID=UPI00232EDCAE|nr:GNAT family N-acetyltransferase [Nodularia spumigena]MDB9354985.1 GNAT family N-acetyltransferase [Nodularia spumigena CS-587/03]MDB9305395.1 GNAT family N-acetyltransferase [Nodularia spumigena CS-591/12]MDB9320257.1 GNAT family N-acetyltransferase [Nodularia spumigena CS-590/01A]MDB9320941.1 GNAT family N-acetyltransferase [Nodularia spumigena CS-591/07A]MDB9324911.1 GNAT family N-acetyltransferase [Nodularia spumigena CS-590/02]
MAARIKMTSLLPRNLSVVIRPAQYRDLDGIEQITQDSFATLTPKEAELAISQMQWLRRWYGFLKFLSWFPNPLKYRFCAYVAEQGRVLLGMIQVSPFNRTRSTWRIDRVMLAPSVEKQAVGSQLLRHCFESILEARTWLLEVSINDKDALALYRQNGFQRLAEMTYWEIKPELLAQLAQAEPDLPNLLPVSNADAQLLYQLDTASMPPLVRQVFDRNTRDFKTSFFGALTDAVKQWVTKTEVVSGYVFEPQRKAAIGYFQVQLDRKGKTPHVARLTVHPAYTWLYPELLSQLARIVQDFPQQGLQLASSDYQAEREEYLERIGAERIEHTLIMSRSVWHKLRESKFVSLEGIQWTGVLQGLQPARKPIPGGMSWVKPSKQPASERPAPTKSEPVAFKCENLSMEPLPIPESTDTTQEN